MTAYEQLRTRINELLPDRLKLERGCLVKFENTEAAGVGMALDERETDNQFILYIYGKYNAIVQRGNIQEILGKPLTIEDVLRAALPYSTVSHDGIFRSGVGERIADFDLTKPLSAPGNDAACAAVHKLLTV